jgi:hypothetical protein
MVIVMLSERYGKDDGTGSKTADREDGTGRAPQGR